MFKRYKGQFLTIPNILATGIDLWEFSGEIAYHGKSIVIDMRNNQ